ncbi:hypothetical protein, partial [Klebsiella pneumoniae]
MAQIERDILPLFRSMETLDDMVAYLATKPLKYRDFEIDELRGVSLHAARGDLEAARAKLDDLR